LPAPPPAERVLVIRLGAVGDVVRTLPAASALRATYPAAHLAWLVEPASAGLLRSQPWIDEVLVFPRDALAQHARRLRLGAALRELSAFVGGLRGRRFDLVVDFHSILKTGLLSRASGAPRRAGYAPPFGREGAWWLANLRAELAPRRVPRFARNLGLVRFLGSEAEPAATPLRVDPALLRALRAQLGPGAPPVALHPGTSDATPHKRWTVEGYAAVAQRLAKDDGVSSIVTFGPAVAERAMAEEIVARSEGAARLAPPTETLAHLAALLASVRLYVGSDTGPMHVASLVGTPVVQILGPTHPIENAPWPATPSRSVRVAVACSPCRRGCATATCLRLVTPDLVERAARELLAVRSAGY
jgi:ADP-heptose:LPS heptosyltransferase